jgi:hypothetical protein
MKSRTVLWFALAPVIQTGSRDVRVPEPLLDLGDVCLVREPVSGRRRAHRAHAEPDHFGMDAARTPRVSRRHCGRASPDRDAGLVSL